MRKFHAYKLSDWPRNRRGEIIFSSTTEAIYYAGIVEDKQVSYNLLKKWAMNAYQNFDHVRRTSPVNHDRLFDLAARRQFFREAMEEIQRLNESIE